MKLTAAFIVLLSAASALAFGPSACRRPASTASLSTSRVRTRSGTTQLFAASVAADSNDPPATAAAATDKALTKQQKRLKQIREEGGPFAFNTKYGALNPFAIYYGLVSIALGLVWFVALLLSQLFYKITGDKLDTRRRLPVTLSHMWGTMLMALTGCFPKIENREIIEEFHKSGRTAMFVSNHNSWMDIPFIGHTIGWINYKFVAKKELEKVPILGKAIKVAKNVLVDRTNRRSQLLTLKQGMKWLNEGVNLCTFPEGTRSRNNRLMPFKNGAFKMAHKAGRPVVPVSICNAIDVMPSYWMFPYRRSGGVCKVVVHEPVESEGISEEELAERVRASIIKGLPEEQRPLSS